MIEGEITIQTPHIPRGTAMSEALDILKTVSPNVEKYEDDRETFYKARCAEFEMGFYESDGKVTAVWYNDPVGRESQDGINTKVSLYLARYGEIEDWEVGINNGWIQFFMNDKNKIGMAYGLHKDVIRFNFFE